MGDSGFLKWRMAIVFLTMLFLFSSNGFSEELSDLSLNAVIRCPQCFQQVRELTVADLIEYIKFISPNAKAIEANQKILVTFGGSKLMFRRVDRAAVDLPAGIPEHMNRAAASLAIPDAYMEEGVLTGAVANHEYAAQKIELIVSESEMRMMEKGVESPSAKKKRLAEAKLLEFQNQQQLREEQEKSKLAYDQTELLSRIKYYQVWAIKGRRSLKFTGHTFFEICTMLKKLDPNRHPVARNTSPQTILMSLGGKYFTVVDNVQQSRLEINADDASEFIWAIVEQGQ